MKATRKIITSVALGTVCVISAVAIAPNLAHAMVIRGAVNETTFTLNADDSPTSESHVASVDKTYRGHTTYRFTEVGYNATGLCTLFEGGRIVKTNDSGYSNGLESITATFTSGELRVVTMYETNDKTYFTYTLTSGVSQAIAGNYFYLEAESDVSLTSFTVNYGCTAGSKQTAPTSTQDLRLNFNAFEDYATVQKIDNDVYFVLKGNYNQTPMASAIRIYHDGPSYYISPSRMDVYPTDSAATVYFKLSGTPFVDAQVPVYYPHMSYNGSTGNLLIYRLVDSKQTAPNPLTTQYDDDALYEIKFPNLAGGMVSINLDFDNLMSPYKRYVKECAAESKTVNSKLILRDTLTKWVVASGYGMGVEYKDGYYYAVRTNKGSTFIVDKLTLGAGGWTVVASSNAVGVSDSTSNDLGRLFIYHDKIYTMDYRAASIEAGHLFQAFNISDMSTVAQEDITLSFGGIAESKIISAAFNDDSDTFVVLASDSFGGSGKLYIYDETNLTTPRANITVALSGENPGKIKDVAFYKDVAVVLQAKDGGGIVFQEFSAAGGTNDKWQQNYACSTRVPAFTATTFNAQALCFNDDGQYVINYASWGGNGDTHTLGIFDVGDALEEETLLNKVVDLRYGTRDALEVTLQETGISQSSYTIQQSAATDGTYVYMLMDKAANQKGRVQKFDMSTYTFTGENSAEFDLAASQVWGAPTSALSYFDGHLHLFGFNGNIYRFANKQDGTVDLSSSEQISNPFEDFTGVIYGISQSRDGEYAVTNNAGLVHIYSQEKALLRTFSAPGRQSFYGNEDYIYVLSSADSTASTWPAGTINVYSYHGSLLFSLTVSGLGDDGEGGSQREKANLANCPSFFEFEGESYLTVGTWTPTYFFDIYKLDYPLK